MRNLVKQALVIRLKLLRKTVNIAVFEEGFDFWLKWWRCLKGKFNFHFHRQTEATSIITQSVIHSKKCNALTLQAITK